MEKKTKTPKELLEMYETSCSYHKERGKIYNALQQMPTLKQLLTEYLKFKFNEEVDEWGFELVPIYMDLLKEDAVGKLFSLEYIKATGNDIGTEWL